MIKKFITFWCMTMLIAFLIPVFAQDSTNVSTKVTDQLVTTTTNLVTDTNAEKLVDKYLEKATVAINGLAQALKTPAEHVYKVLIKQRVIYAYSILIIIFICIIIGLVAIIWPYKHWQNANKKYVSSNNHVDKDYQRWDIDEGGWLFSIVPGGILIAIAIIVLFTNMPEITTGLFNPEYGAIKEIMKMF